MIMQDEAVSRVCRQQNGAECDIILNVQYSLGKDSQQLHVYIVIIVIIAAAHASTGHGPQVISFQGFRAVCKVWLYSRDKHSQGSTLEQAICTCLHACGKVLACLLLVFQKERCQRG